jgi:hypothetical protein
MKDQPRRATRKKDLGLGGHATKRETANEALSEYIARRKRLAAVRAFGTFAFDPSYDPKRERRRR